MALNKNSSKLLPLTPNEKDVLEFIENYLLNSEVAPTFKDIKTHFGFASFNSVQRYLKQLQDKGYLHMPGGNQKRAIVVLHSARSVHDSMLALRTDSSQRTQRVETAERVGGQGDVINLPLLGRVAAGQPVEAYEHDESLSVPRNLVRHASSTFALRVQGSSMIGEGIFDGDLILVQKQSQAENGNLVVAHVNHEATVKRYYVYPSGFPKSVPKNVRSIDGPVVELRPSNPDLNSMWYPSRQVGIEGIVVGLIRKY